MARLTITYLPPPSGKIRPLPAGGGRFVRKIGPARSQAIREALARGDRATARALTRR